jgi:Ca2+-binding EF-hand superfamily protein
MHEMDLQHKGHVLLEEWVHYALLNESHRAAAQINSSLREAMKRYPRLLEDLQRLFKAADVAKSGRLNLQEVIQMYMRKLWHIHPSSDLLTEAELQTGDPEQLAREVMKAMDVDGDNTISYAEFMAFCLGRRKQQVILHQYDVSAGLGKSLTPLLGDELQQWWHTGIVVYGREYFWACETVHDDPGKTAFGTPYKATPLGFTLWRQDELHDYIINELQPLFHRETYDIITNNCNHFSDRLLLFLLGRRLPDEVLNQDESLQKLTTIKLVRPLLQWWSREAIGATALSAAQSVKLEELETDTALPPGTLVGIHAAHRRDGSNVIPGMVSTPEQPIKRLGGHRVGAPLALCSCTGVDITSREEVCVCYFDISLHSSLRRCVGEVVTEYVPRSRLALMTIKNIGDESLYQKALLMMNVVGTHNRRSIGASGGLRRPAPSTLPGSLDKDDLIDDLLDDFPDAGGLADHNSSSTLWSVMASPGKIQSEHRDIAALTSHGFSAQVAAAALSSTEWQVEEALALLLARERLRSIVSDSSMCPLQVRLGQPRPPQPSDPDPATDPSVKEAWADGGLLNI